MISPSLRRANPVGGERAAPRPRITAQESMEPESEPPSSLELFVRRVIDNLRSIGSVDGVDMQLLHRILPHCSLNQLTRIESLTKKDLTPVTDVLWKRFYQLQFGEENTNQVVGRMQQSGVVYKSKDLFSAKTEKLNEMEGKMGERVRKNYQAEKAERQRKQIKFCTKVPPSGTRSCFGVTGSSGLCSSSYKHPMLKKARMEVDIQAKMQAAVRRSVAARPSQPARLASSHRQPTRTIHRPNSTITVTRPTGVNMPNQISRLRF